MTMATIGPSSHGTGICNSLKITPPKMPITPVIIYCLIVWKPLIFIRKILQFHLFKNNYILYFSSMKQILAKKQIHNIYFVMETYVRVCYSERSVTGFSRVVVCSLSF